MNNFIEIIQLLKTFRLVSSVVHTVSGDMYLYFVKV